MQGDLAEKQDEAAAAQGDVVLSLANIYKALGGGWEMRCAEHLAPFGQAAPAAEPDTTPEQLPGPDSDPGMEPPLPMPTLPGEEEDPLVRLPPLP
ncbi:MAG: hypothetical protein AAGF97_02955 [Planctomycetota bacterium]